MSEIRFKKRQKHGKYRIESCLTHGPYAGVYSALDTIEGVRVALKIPNRNLQNKDDLGDFIRETRIAAKLHHPNVLTLKDASYIDGLFTMVSPLGQETLESRLKRRLSTEKAFDYAKQLIQATAFAHRQGIMHCDIKPANMILFPNGRLLLADFGIAKTASRTVHASGSGTLGYLAPEQAMGRPSLRSDVFSIGLILHQMLCGQTYEWPFKWPSKGIKRLKQRAHPNMIALLRRALEFQPQARFRDAGAMLNCYLKLERAGQLHGKSRGSSGRLSVTRNFTGTKSVKHWRRIQHRQFQKLFGKKLDTHLHCAECDGPVAEQMQSCPWCRVEILPNPEHTRFPSVCPHCDRGVKKDWDYCAWCFGSGFEKETNTRYKDKRYTATCKRSSCGGPLMPFMKYCPWCHGRNKNEWTVKGMTACDKCSWGVAEDYWSFCPWCSSTLQSQR